MNYWYAEDCREGKPFFYQGCGLEKATHVQIHGPTLMHTPATLDGLNFSGCFWSHEAERKKQGLDRREIVGGGGKWI